VFSASARQLAPSSGSLGMREPQPISYRQGRRCRVVRNRRARFDGRMSKRPTDLRIRYFLEPSSGLPHVYAHGVSEEEVAFVRSRPGEDRAGREGSRVALGRASSGRYLRVVDVPDVSRNGVFVITAMELSGKALHAYRRRRRRRHE